MVDQNFEGEVYYLEFEDENGNKQYFTEDVVLNHEGREYEGQDDTYMILASIEKNEEGVEVYVPLDEEDEVFETLVKLYEEMEDGE